MTATMMTKTVTVTSRIVTRVIMKAHGHPHMHVPPQPLTHAWSLAGPGECERELEWWVNANPYSSLARALKWLCESGTGKWYMVEGGRGSEKGRRTRGWWDTHMGGKETQDIQRTQTQPNIQTRTHRRRDSVAHRHKQSNRIRRCCWSLTACRVGLAGLMRVWMRVWLLSASETLRPWVWVRGRGGNGPNEVRDGKYIQLGDGRELVKEWN